jgi:hypothetical protein
MRSLTYHRLLPNALFRNLETDAKSSASHEAALNAKPSRTETKTPLPLGQAGKNVRPRRERGPQLVFDSRNKVRCVFFTLVVKLETLKEKYKGGILAFLKRHGARSNRNFAYMCVMNENDLTVPILDIKKRGLISDLDFVCFDATWRALGVEMPAKLGLKTQKRVQFPVEWLAGYVENGGVIIYYVESAKGANKA